MFRNEESFDAVEAIKDWVERSAYGWVQRHLP